MRALFVGRQLNVGPEPSFWDGEVGGSGKVLYSVVVVGFVAALVCSALLAQDWPRGGLE